MTLPTHPASARPDRPAVPGRSGGTAVAFDEQSDVALLDATRAGDQRALGELYRRHYATVRRTAQRIASRSGLDADELSAEAFTCLVVALQRGSGPVDNPVPYLFVTMRNRQIAEYHRTVRRQDLAQRLGHDLREPATFIDRDPALISAMRSLTPRHRLVLWWTVVEGRTPQDIAPLLAISPNAAAALSLRARRALATAYRSHPAADRRQRPDRQP